MFNKTKKSNAAEMLNAVPVPAGDPNQVAAKKAVTPLVQSPKATSMVFSNITIHGDVTGSGDLHLDGTVHGDVKVGNLTVGESGNIEGSVSAAMIEVRGRVMGSINGKQIKLMATAYVEGDITHDSLAIEVGAYFQGRCLQNRKLEVIPAPQGEQSVAVAGPSLSNYDLNSLSDLKA